MDEKNITQEQALHSSPLHLLPLRRKSRSARSPGRT